MTLNKCLTLTESLLLLKRIKDMVEISGYIGTEKNNLF